MMSVQEAAKEPVQLPLIPHRSTDKSTVYLGDAFSVLKGLPSETYQTAITSPPYWGLRDYDENGQIEGSRERFDDYVERLVDVFSELRRVLRCYVLAQSRGLYTSGGRKWREPIRKIQRGQCPFEPQHQMVSNPRTWLVFLGELPSPFKRMVGTFGVR